MLKDTIKKILIIIIRLILNPQNKDKVFYNPKNNKILIISCIGIGNTILSIPLIRTILITNKTNQIDILTNDIASYNIINRLKIVNKIYLLSKSYWINIKIIKRLRVNEYQYCFVTFPTLSLPIEIIPILIKSRINVIHDYRSFHNYLNKLMIYYNTIIPINQQIHDVEQNKNLLSGMRYRKYHQNIYPKYQLTHTDYKYLENFKNINKVLNNKIILIHPGSNEINSHKRWPIEKYLILAKRLMTNRNIKVFFIIGPDEKNIIPILENQKMQYINNVSIIHLMAIIKISTLLISNDSGIMHLASLVDIPIITIWGATNDRRNCAASAKTINVINEKISCRPCINIISEKRHNCNNECIRDIHVDKVIQYAEKILNES